MRRNNFANQNLLLFLLIFFLILFLSPFPLHAADYLQEQEVKTLISQEHYPEAIDLLKKMLLVQPKNLDWQMELANLYRKNQQWDEASELYNKILSQKPKHQDALMGKAYVLRHQKDFVQGRELANRVLEINPKNVDVLSYLADLEMRESHLIASKDLYEQVLKIQPDNSEAIEGLKKLDALNFQISRSERNVVGPLALANKPWQFEAGGGVQTFNYNTSAPSAYALGIYKKPKRYYVLGRFDYLDKFGDTAYQFTAGGGYYVHPKIILNDAISGAVTDFVAPQFQNIFEVDGILPKGFVPYLRYTYKHYDVVDVNVVQPGFQWYYSNWFILDLNYSLAINNFDALPSGRMDSSFGGKVIFIPIENRLSFFMYYARTEESFDTGTSITFGRFHANVFGGGFEGFVPHDIGIRFYTDYENRDNGQTVHSYNAALLYRY